MDEFVIEDDEIIIVDGKEDNAEEIRDIGHAIRLMCFERGKTVKQVCLEMGKSRKWAYPPTEKKLFAVARHLGTKLYFERSYDWVNGDGE